MSAFTALVLIVIGGFWQRGVPSVSAETSHMHVVQNGPSCPLSASQQLASVKAWAKMMPVFRHPRCINCHGLMPKASPRQVKVDGEWRWTPTVRHAGIVDIEAKDGEQVCEECHMDRWANGQDAPDWTDKSDMDICRGMHVVFSNDGGGGAPSFIDHIKRDGGNTPFIEAAFRGMRGLTEGGQTIYENETGQPIKAAPPPGSHGQLLQQANDWVSAQGGKFVGDKDCGCVVDRLDVKVRSTMTITTTDETSTITGVGNALIKLGPELSAPQWDVATGVHGVNGDMNWSNVSIKMSNGCVIDIVSSPTTKSKFWVGMSVVPDVKISLELVPEPDIHNMRKRCPNPVTGRLVGSLSADNKLPGIFMGAWTALHGGATTSVAAATATFDVNRMKSMDPKALQAMAEAMKSQPPEQAAAQLKALMNQMVPGASKMAAAVKNNYRFAIPGNGCKLTPNTEFIARCDFDRTVTVADPRMMTAAGGGAASNQTITEKTTITFGKESAARL